jgi:light-regulated signal transduction histidine kinase (bacteriophytochrome)
VLVDISEEPVMTTKGLRIFHTKKIPILDQKGKPVYLLGISEDITERKKAEAELAKTTEELRRSNRELEMFAYVASHDLQEPLRMVASYTQLLQRRYQGKLDQSADEFIHFAVDGAKRMQAFINDLLQFSRVNTKGRPFAPVDLNDVARRVRSNLKIAIEETDAAVTFDPMPTLTGDDSQLTQLFQNLVGNALKFRKKDEPPRVHVSAKCEGDDWQFAVTDNGIGIAPEYFEKIFIIFQRLHTRDEYPGTGIGLAVCKRIVERHGGRIWIESEPDKGAAFLFTIPVKQAANEEIPG